MGVKGLYSYLRPYRQPVDTTTLPKGLIGVDALSVLYKFRGNTEAILTFLEPFRAAADLLFVFDGKAPESKKDEIDERKSKRNTAAAEADTLRAFLKSATMDERDRRILERKIQVLDHGAWSMTRETRHAFQDVLRAHTIRFVKAKGEADDVLMSLWSDRRIIGIISTDMDFLVAGVERLWIPSPRPEEITLSSVLKNEDLSLSSFRDAAILCGVSTGYTFVNMYPHKAFTFMRHYGSLERLFKKQPAVFADISQDVLNQVRIRFLICVKPEELVREEYRALLDVDSTEQAITGENLEK
jgi:5'-3' exonuclease